MERFSGRGILSCADATVVGSANIEANDNGQITVEFRCDASPYQLLSYVGDWVELNVDLECGAVHAGRVFVNKIGPTVMASIPSMVVSRSASAGKRDEFEYRLSNCLFAMGSHLTENGRGGGAWDAIELCVEGVTLRTTKLESYREIVESAKDGRTAAVTANMLISGAKSKVKADSLADAFCYLFSFATKNSVRWISRDSVLAAGTETEFVSPQIYPLRTSWSLLPDIPIHGEHQLYAFLAAALPNYKELSKQIGLPETIGWLLDSEMTSAIQPSARLQPRKVRNGHSSRCKQPHRGSD